MYRKISHCQAWRDYIPNPKRKFRDIASKKSLKKDFLPSSFSFGRYRQTGSIFAGFPSSNNGILPPVPPTSHISREHNFSDFPIDTAPERHTTVNTPESFLPFNALQQCISLIPTSSIPVAVLDISLQQTISGERKLLAAADLRRISTSIGNCQPQTCSQFCWMSGPNSRL